MRAASALSSAVVPWAVGSTQPWGCQPEGQEWATGAPREVIGSRPHLWSCSLQDWPPRFWPSCPLPLRDDLSGSDIRVVPLVVSTGESTWSWFCFLWLWHTMTMRTERRCQGMSRDVQLGLRCSQSSFDFRCLVLMALLMAGHWIIPDTFPFGSLTWQPSIPFISGSSYLVVPVVCHLFVTTIIVPLWILHHIQP